MAKWVMVGLFNTALPDNPATPPGAAIMCPNCPIINEQSFDPDNPWTNKAQNPWDQFLKSGTEGELYLGVLVTDLDGNLGGDQIEQWIDAHPGGNESNFRIACGGRYCLTLVK